ncbi:EAL domain-containing protein [Vibrio sp. 10N.261.55.A7]|uniref:EAL domain-containing protein n=1 Tax=Vibrio sp. 10N.261.55.A7 TaxID=1880851 RepID=UPI000C820E4A|nr:EAL domain-containing protein [Vibrio sp. 10N.261.55.A7]PMJ93140.1 diguanylate phosphodiesterase [Vibrio sp. 10N.261.55.A7]
MLMTDTQIHVYCSLAFSSLRKHLKLSLQALRQGMIWLIPCLMISSFSLFFASLGEFITHDRNPFIEHLYLINKIVVEFFPFLLTSALSYTLAMQWKIARPPVILLSLVYLISIQELLLPQGSSATYHIVLSILTPLYSVPILTYLTRFRSLKLVRTDVGGRIVKESLNLVLPSVITIMLVFIITHWLFVCLSYINVIDGLSLDYANAPYEFGFAFAALNSALWFVGIHGYYALLPLVDMLQEASQLNYSTNLAGGDSPYVMNLPFMGVFVFIGGSGATLSLIVALLALSKQKAARYLALASIPIGLFNVNEILLFGLPIIFNPRLFLPFLIVPLVNVLVGLTAVEFGYVSTPSFPVPFNSPVFINAWIATNGEINAVILQLVNIFIGSLIYIPAVLSMNKQHDSGTITFHSLDTTYQRLRESAKLESEDIVQIVQSKANHLESLEQHVERISHNEFCLEYQPQISTTTGKVVGAEALVRAIDNDGNLQAPYTFLPWLDDAGLTQDLDLWVFKRAVRDIIEWRKVGIDIPISVNIGSKTLVDRKIIEQIIQLVEPVSSLIHIEITEQSLLEDEQELSKSLNELYKLGIPIYIDDFGTGFSSFSYLNRFDISAIKIDRSFVLALSNERGKKVFESLLNIAKLLELEVVVEGVETIEHLEHIPKEPSISVQGWYYSKSLSVNDFNVFMDKLNRE